MSRYIVGAEGCDGSTYVVAELTDEQAKGFEIAAAATVAKSNYGCEAVIYFATYENADSYQRESAEETNDDE